jgi:hypothetical protein
MRICLAVAFVCCSALLSAQSDSCYIGGAVEDANAHPISGGLVRLFDEQGLSKGAVGIGDDGKFQSAGVPCGATYLLRVEHNGYLPFVQRNIALNASIPDLRVTLYEQPEHRWQYDWLIATLLGLLYMIGLVFFRWHNVALLDRKLLQAEVATTRARLQIQNKILTGKDKDVDSRVKILNSTLDEALEEFRLESDYRRRHKSEHENVQAGENAQPSWRRSWNWQRPRPIRYFSDIFFWTRGDEIAAWTVVREVQRQMVYFVDPDATERLRARLQIAQQELQMINSTPANALADSIKINLAGTPEPERWRQLLGEALRVIFEDREQGFADLTGWQSKATWIAITACTLIVCCVAARGAAVLFLVGAAGGFLSRLARALQAKGTPTDYGASWNTLFLSPLFGALAGWFGVILLQGLGSLDILSPNLLDKLNQPLTSISLAFLLGFSERFFDTLVKSFDKKLLTGDQDQTADEKTTTSTTAAVLPAGTTVADVRPANPWPGAAVCIIGTALDSANVDGISLQKPDKSNVDLTGVTQDATEIWFGFPSDAVAGEVYTLTVKAKSRNYITRSLTVGARKPAADSGASSGLGVTGPSGPSGPSGASGLTGVSGASTGPIATRPSGPSGPSGATGPTGPSDASGPSGPSVASGPFGDSSVSGPSGPTGPSGATGQEATGSMS